MSENKDILSIRTKLQGFTAEAPSFDALFRGEELGEAGLRHVCQSKLLNHAVEAPSFETLMAPGLPQPRKRQVSFALWATGLAAAACLGLFLLLPVPVEQAQQGMGSVLERVQDKPLTQKVLISQEQESPLLTEVLPTQTSVDINQTEEPVSSVVYKVGAVSDTTSHSSPQDQLIKLESTELSTLETAHSLGVYEAYAKAKLAVKHRKQEKMQAGVNVNGSNRLLSFVNTNQGSDPLLSTSSEYNRINVLDGSQGISLRSTDVSKNEWRAPDNLLPSSLNNYEATYSLPINVGLSLSIPINSVMELQTGCYYSYLFSKTEGMTGTSSFSLRRELHYLGIPVKLAFNIYKRNGLRAYLALGGAIEKGLSGKQESTVVSQDGSENTWKDSQPVYGVQPSTNGLAGISYEYKSGLSMFLEPGVSYCYDTDQPSSIRTEEPFSFNVGLGLRYRLK